MAELLEDLSYSNITNIVQNDKTIGKKCIIEIVCELENAKVAYEKISHDLKMKQVEIDLLNSGIERIFKHLKLDKPLSVMANGFVIDFTQNGYYVQKNIL